MSGRIRNKVGLIAAVAAAIAVMVPATLALGNHSELSLEDGESVVLLELGQTDRVTWIGAETPQSLTLKKNCTVQGAGGPLLEIEAIGGDLGNDKDGLGVRSAGDGRGEPCGRTEFSDGEAISVSLGGDLTGYLMTAVDLDLELKFNAVVDVSYVKNGSEVASDSFNPMGGSDDGPDSTDGDNYRYRHRPVNDEDGQVLFDKVVLTAGAGSFSLEGGADLVNGGEPGDLDPTSVASQFAVIQAFDGVIDCGQPFTDLGDTETISGEVLMHSQAPVPVGEGTSTWIATSCIKKPFNEDVSLGESPGLAFMPVDPDIMARYTLDVTVRDQPVETDGAGLITSLKAIYNEDGNLTFPDGGDGVEACNGTPLLDDSVQPDYDDYWTASTLVVPGSSDPIMPAGESVCFYSASVSPTGLVETGPGVFVLFGTEEWSFLIFADPGIGFR